VSPAPLLLLTLGVSCALGPGERAETPPDMVLVPGGPFTMGRDFSPHPDETPAHTVQLDPFWLDETLVTVADFRAYVERGGVVTSAERIGYGKTAVEGMDDWEWSAVPGATWRSPWGTAPGAPRPQDDEPVVMVSWEDAEAYCRARGARLPTEAEWEGAMRAGARGRFPWGEEPTLPSGRYGLNFWQGESHHKNERLDGYLYLSPVRAFPPNRLGLYDPVGNVWQWVADWYAPDTYSQRAALTTPALNPQGPSQGALKVTRGGSWWCSSSACSGYGLFARGKTRPFAPFSNNGFRCAKDVEPAQSAKRAVTPIGVTTR
jgi:sulfatase modifying factor 1